MPFLAYVFSALLLLSGASVMTLGDSQLTAKDSSQEVSAASLRIMAGVAQQYIAANPAKTGEVTASELSPYTPTWLKADARVHVVAQGGRAFVYIAPTGGDRLSIDSVVAGGEAPVTLGIVTAGKLVSPLAGVVGIQIPSSIPEGSVVYVV